MTECPQPRDALDDVLPLIIFVDDRIKARWLLDVGSVCHRWHAIADSNDTWRDVCWRKSPASVSLMGVTSYKRLHCALSATQGYIARNRGERQANYAQIGSEARSNAPTADVHRPALEEYQFIVDLFEGETRLMSTCLRGQDVLATPPEPGASAVHRTIAWGLALDEGTPPTAALQSDDHLSAWLDEVAGRTLYTFEELFNLPGSRDHNDQRHWERVGTSQVFRKQTADAWRLSITAFRARDQRCCRLLRSSVTNEDPSRSFFPGFAALEFGQGYVDEVNAACPLLDARRLSEEEGITLTDCIGQPWFVNDKDDPAQIFFQATLRPQWLAPGKADWRVEFDLVCDGPSVNPNDPARSDGGLLLGSLQHDLFCRALDEAVGTTA